MKKCVSLKNILKIILIRSEKSAVQLTGPLTALLFPEMPCLGVFIFHAGYFDICAFLALFSEPHGTCSLIKCNNSWKWGLLVLGFFFPKDNNRGFEDKRINVVTLGCLLPDLVSAPEGTGTEQMRQGLIRWKRWRGGCARTHVDGHTCSPTISTWRTHWWKVRKPQFCNGLFCSSILCF